MPKYTFRCLDCQKEYQVSCAFDQREQMACPDCQSKKKQQLFSNFNVSIKQKKTVCNAADACPNFGKCPHH
ncbi:MAG: FmdB family zinc ribbon protein [Bacillota bacterium]